MRGERRCGQVENLAQIKIALIGAVGSSRIVRMECVIVEVNVRKYIALAAAEQTVKLERIEDKLIVRRKPRIVFSLVDKIICIDRAEAEVDLGAARLCRRYRTVERVLKSR